MARGPCTFRQLDITRAIRAAFAAGATRARIQIGGIIVTADKGVEGERVALPDVNEWDTPPAGEGTQ
jgi:hypothetical protein